MKFISFFAGLQDSDDEDIEGDIDQQIESMLAPKRIIKEIKAPIDGSAISSLAGSQSTGNLDVIKADAIRLIFTFAL